MPRLLVGCAVLVLASVRGGAAPPNATEQAFERHVRPILVEHCQDCHGAKKQMGGLRLDSPEALNKGGDGGTVVKPGDPEGSRLVQAIRHVGELKMPPRKKLSAEAVAALEAWVKAGAAWPAERVAVDREAWRRHWAFQAVRQPPAPNPRNGKQAGNPIDSFLLEKLHGKGLSLSPEADRRTLIRRLTFDLVGLPPTPEVVDAF